MSTPILPSSPQQFRLATSKARLSAIERAILDYLCAWSIDNPDEEVQRSGIVSAGHAVMADALGYNPSNIWRALVGFPERGQLGLVGKRIVHRWRRGSGGLEGAYSLSGAYDEWLVAWGPVVRGKNPATRDQVLLELQTVDLIARHRAMKPAYLVARSRDENGRPMESYRRVVRRKSKVSFRAMARDETANESSRVRATNIVQFPGASPSSRDSSNLLVEKPEEERHPAIIKTTPGAQRVLDAIQDANRGKALFDSKQWQPRREVVQALCDIEDVGYIVAAINRIQPRPLEAVQMVKDLAHRGAPAVQRSNGFDANCDECRGRGFTIDDAGDAVPCPVCRAEEVAQ